MSSAVRWLTLFGHSYMQLSRAEPALDFYERALKLARSVPEIAFPVMTYVGKADALIKLGRVEESETLVRDALAEATQEGSAGYRAELTMRLACWRDFALFDGLCLGQRLPSFIGRRFLRVEVHDGAPDAKADALHQWAHPGRADTVVAQRISALRA